MCGILGVFGDRALKVDVETVLPSLRHRGPDDDGTYSAHRIRLGMRRLAILDPEHGQQPVSDEAGHTLAICNGEIYNFVELRRELQGKGHRFVSGTDTEVLVHLYEEEGPDLVHRLRGMFAFALWDDRAKRLVLGRDRFGKKPLYVHSRDGTWCFASEIKAVGPLVGSAHGIELEIDPQAIYDYLTLGAIPQPTTAYRDVRCLPPGHLMILDDSGAKLKRYWAPDFHSTSRIEDLDEAGDAVRRILREAVRIRLRSDVPLGVFLSGGIDSSIVAYEAAQANLDEPLRTFTVKVADEALDESPVARRTAAVLGVENTLLNLDVAPQRDVLFIAEHFDQPFADSSAIPTLGISREARKHVTVVLNGDGGDEIFLGYRRQLAASWLQRLPWIEKLAPLARPAGALAGFVPRRSGVGFGSRFLRGLGSDAEKRWLAWGLDFLTEEDKAAIWRGERCRPTEQWLSEQIEGSDPLTQMISLDVKVNLLGDLLVKMDMGTMAASLEARSPFLDHEVAELAFSLPYRLRARGGTTKRVLRSAYRGRLPDEVLDAPKRGFEVPLRSWLDNELRDLLHDSLLGSDARIGRFVDPAAVRSLVEGRAFRDRNATQLTYAFLMLELWLRQSRSSGSSGSGG